MINLLGGNSSILGNASSVLMFTRYDNTLFFNSDNDVVTIPSVVTNMLDVKNNFSISALINAEEIGSSGNRFVILSKRESGSGNIYGYELFILKNSNTSYSVIFLFFGEININSISYTVLSDIRNKWIHVTVNKYNSAPFTSVSATEWEMFVNGASVTPTVTNNSLTTSTVTTSAQVITMNNIAGNSFYSKMNLARVLIYGKRLSLAEANLLYESKGEQKPDVTFNIKTGTITTPNVGSLTLTGTGTLFLTELQAGMILYSTANVPLGYIRSITNNTTAIYVQASTIASYTGTYKAGFLIASYDFNEHSGTILADATPAAANGTLANFANTSLGSVNQWREANNLNPWTV